MTSEFGHNPFQPPGRRDVGIAVGQRSGSPSWLKWSTITVVSTLLISAALLASGERFLGYPLGISISVLCGGVLLLMAVIAGKRFAFKTALILTQLLNLLTWVTMLGTVYFVLPLTQGKTLRSHEFWVFAWILLGAAILVVPITGVGCLLHVTRRASPRTATSGKAS